MIRNKAFSAKATCLGLLALTAFLGCGSPKANFQSKKDAAYDKKLERVFILYSTPSEVETRAVGHDFSNEVAKQVAQRLADHNVPAATFLVERDALDNSAATEAAQRRFRTKQVLSFSVTLVSNRREMNRLTPEMSVTLEFKLWDTQTRTAVWRTRATFISTPALPADVANQLVEQFVSARLL